MKKLDRRLLLSGTAKNMVVMGTATALSRRNIMGANERIRIALIGCGGRGRIVARNTAVEKNAEITYLCDLNQTRLDEAMEFIKDVQPRKPKTTKHIKEVLDSKEIDGVIVATPDHWHSLA